MKKNHWADLGESTFVAGIWFMYGVYRLFGRLEACPLPPPGLKDRFVDQGLS